jgi:hypothetical protein
VPSTQCSVGDIINSVGFQLIDSACYESRNSQDEKFFCENTDVSIPSEGTPVQVSCVDGSDTPQLFFDDLSTTMGGFIVVENVNGGLPDSLVCKVKTEQGIEIQKLTIDTSGGEDLYLKNTFGMLQLDSCTVNNRPTQSCTIPIQYRYTVSNQGSTFVDVVKVERTRNSQLMDLTPQASITELRAGGNVLGDSTSMVEDDIIDLCSPEMYETTVLAQSDTQPPGAPCFDLTQYMLNFSGVGHMDVDISCTSEDGVECINLGSKIEDCWTSMTYTFDVKNVGTTELTIDYVEILQKGNDLDMAAFFVEKKIKPGEKTSVDYPDSINLCVDGQYETTVTVKATSDIQGTSESWENFDSYPFEIKVTPFPTLMPSSSPTKYITPTQSPSATPSATPSSEPSPAPSPVPTRTPTERPTTIPSPAPSAVPTTTESAGPSPIPSQRTSGVPTVVSSGVPTVTPTTRPSNRPTPAPSATPTVTMSAKPTPVPTMAESGVPTSLPSLAPSTRPSTGPKFSQTSTPSSSPSSSPTASPSISPISAPSAAPSTHPSSGPKLAQTNTPASSPFSRPSASPSSSPSSRPSESPSSSPSSSPSASPISSPSSRPSASPISSPSSRPSASPSSSTSGGPTASPSSSPSSRPTTSPSTSPSSAPSDTPTDQCQIELNVQCIAPVDLSQDGSCNFDYLQPPACQQQPTQMILRYNGGDCSRSHNLQRNSLSTCEDYGHDNFGPSLQKGVSSYIRAFDPGNSVNMYYDGFVKVGDDFAVSGSFAETLNITIYDPKSFTNINDIIQPENILQTIVVHTTCPTPATNLFLKDRFGSIQLIEFQNSQQGTVSSFQILELSYEVSSDFDMELLSVDIVTNIENDNYGIYNVTNYVAGTIIGPGNSVSGVQIITIDLSRRTKYSAQGVAVGSKSDGHKCYGSDLTEFTAGVPLPPSIPTIAPTAAPSVSAFPSPDPLLTKCDLDATIICKRLNGESCDDLKAPLNKTCIGSNAEDLSFVYVPSSVCNGTNSQDSFTCTDFNTDVKRPFSVFLKVYGGTDIFFEGIVSAGQLFDVPLPTLNNEILLSLSTVSPSGNAGTLLQTSRMSVACREEDALTLLKTFGSLQLNGFKNAQMGSQYVFANLELSYTVKNVGRIDSLLTMATTDSPFTGMADELLSPNAPKRPIGPGDTETFVERATVNLVVALGERFDFFFEIQGEGAMSNLRCYDIAELSLEIR